uniref:superoxide dismutase n=1 Tax=Aegilops tauschii subsp. strangulata TaxID=200361 RepID=A0A453AS67_AEGTS
MVKAVAVLTGSEGVKGTIFFTQEGDGPTTVTGSVTGLKEGLHGFHVHALGDTTNGCMSTGTYISVPLPAQTKWTVLTGVIDFSCRTTLQPCWSCAWGTRR